MKKKSKAATFRGRCIFPFDMLRYDACYPVGSVDVLEMSYTTDKEIRKDYSDEKRFFQVKVCRADGADFTVERWASFGWHLVETE